MGGGRYSYTLDLEGSQVGAGWTRYSREQGTRGRAVPHISGD